MITIMKVILTNMCISSKNIDSSNSKGDDDNNSNHNNSDEIIRTIPLLPLMVLLIIAIRITVVMYIIITLVDTIMHIIITSFTRSTIPLSHHQHSKFHHSVLPTSTYKKKMLLSSPRYKGIQETHGLCWFGKTPGRIETTCHVFGVSISR